MDRQNALEFRLEEIEGFLQGFFRQGFKLERLSPTRCLVGALGGRKKAAELLECSLEEIDALECGFEDWSGASRLKYEFYWDLGQLVYEALVRYR